jgi:hypothetical protein
MGLALLKRKRAAYLNSYFNGGFQSFDFLEVAYSSNTKSVPKNHIFSETFLYFFQAVRADQ